MDLSVAKCRIRFGLFCFFVCLPVVLLLLEITNSYGDTDWQRTAKCRSMLDTDGSGVSFAVNGALFWVSHL